jgi:threonylcarbamoyladenosine tRNA methylthiotransferase CDKAL1
VQKKVFIAVGGCNRRGLDASRLIDYFRANRCRIMGSPDSADYILFLTCAYKKKAEDICIDIIKRFNKYKSELIVLGCLPGISLDRLKSIFDGKYLATKDINTIDNFFPYFKVKFNEIPDSNFSYGGYKPILDVIASRKKQLPLIKSLFCRLFKRKRLIIPKKKAILRISEGCNGKCSYCSISKATGKQKSKPTHEILKEYSDLLKKGYRFFTLSAEDTGSYGSDIGTKLPELLNNMSKIDKGYCVKWHIQTISPKYAIRYQSTLIDLIRKGKIVLIKCDIQSGNKRILSLMNRYPEVKDILSLYSRFKKANKRLITYSNFIIGFPSETDDEFKDTLRIMKKLELDIYEIFSYSDRHGSISSRLSNKVQSDIMMKRLTLVHDVFRRKYDSIIDQDMLVLLNYSIFRKIKI